MFTDDFTTDDEVWGQNGDLKKKRVQRHARILYIKKKTEMLAGYQNLIPWTYLREQFWSL